MKFEIPEKCRINAESNRSVGYATVGIAGGVFAEAITHTASQVLYASQKWEDIMQNSTSVCAVIWGGINQLGRQSVQVVMSLSVSSGGGRIGRDGIDGPICGCTPAYTVADIEGEEMLLPMIHLTNSYRLDSGGFGKYRGGTGVIGIMVAHGSDQIVTVGFGMGSKVSIDQGLFGGYPRAATSLDILSDTDFYSAIKEGRDIPYEYDELIRLLKGRYEGQLPTIPVRPAKPGDIVVLCNTGGAGAGDPIEREPKLIVKDIKEHKATLEVSNRVYCVAINQETLEVDYEKTERLREKKRKERLKKGIPGKEYLKNVIERRREKNLPQPALEHHEEMLSFSNGYRKMIRKEEEWVEKDFESLKRVKIKRVLLSLTPYINIVEDSKGGKVYTCSKCEFAYCNLEDNWKLYCLIYERDPKEIREKGASHDKEWCVYREFYCPGCGTQVEVESCPPGAPIMPGAKVKI
jgi:acetone carboxylase gamma subunit